MCGQQTTIMTCSPVVTRLDSSCFYIGVGSACTYHHTSSDTCPILINFGTRYLPALWLERSDWRHRICDETLQDGDRSPWLCGMLRSSKLWWNISS